METLWEVTGCSAGTWNLFQTRVKPVLVCSVDRPIGIKLFKGLMCNFITASSFSLSSFLKNASNAGACLHF